MPEHSDPSTASPPPAESPADALHRLEERLGRAAGAAERLIAEAAATVASGSATGADDAGADARAAAGAGGNVRKPDDVPPAGWAPPGDPEPRGRLGDEIELLIRMGARLAELVPPDLRRRLTDAMRELLLAVRALIDWYVARIDRQAVEPPTAVDIPIL